MTNGIGNVSGYGNGYPVGGYPKNGGANPDKSDITPASTTTNHEETQVDPAKVMDFLAANNYFVPTVEAKPIGEVNPETAARVHGYMENFELIYGIIVDEFGEELAPDVMDFAMDYLMGLAA